MENSQSKQQITNDDLQKQKRIEAITKQLKSGLIESFKISIASDDQFKQDNQISSLSVDFPFVEQGPDLSTVEPEFVLNEISNASQANYQSHYSLHDGQYTCNIQKSFYQSNTQSIHSDQPKEQNQLNNQLSSSETRKKLQERLNQKKTSGYSSSSSIDSKNFHSSSTTFAKNQSLNIAVVSPVVSSQNYAQIDQEAKSNKIDNESKSTSQSTYRKTVEPQQQPNTTYKYSLMPESYSYTTPNQQTMTTTVTVTTKHFPQQINSPSYPPIVKQDKVQCYPSPLYASSKVPPSYDQNESLVYKPVDNSNRSLNENYFEPSNQMANYSNFKKDDPSPNIEINTKINVNFQMADAYAQKAPSKSYSYQNTSPAMINRANDYVPSYDNYKKMASSYPVYDQSVFTDQPSLSNYQQNQYLRQSYESVCVSRAQPNQNDLSYGNFYAKNEFSVKEMGHLNSSNDLAAINTEMCDFQNFDEEPLNENMYFLQNLLID